MGFAASQARFLSLTARISDNEYEAQQISQERLALNDQMNIFAEEYEDAISNQVIVTNVFDDNGLNKAQVALTYDVIVKDPLNGGMGMKLVTSSGLVVVPSAEDIPEGEDASNYFIFEQARDVETLQQNLTEGNFYLTSDALKDKETGEYIKKSVEQIDYTTKIYDTTDDAVAKAKYDKRMRAAERKDSEFEMRLNQIETEHTALTTELDSLEKVIDNNVESSFKTFS